MARPVFTIGHSTRSSEDFLQILRAHGVQLLADVRSIPKSRRNPQFHQDALHQALEASGIAYLHLRGLGGLRKPRRDSVNTAWRVEGFRGYADYMQTPEFAGNIRLLIDQAAERQTAVMCAEALWWQCHRQLLSDALVARGVPVEHILSETRRDPHRLTAYACVDGERITYPGIMGA